MKTDTDALAAYAEAWKPGDPLPAGMEIYRPTFDDSTYTWIRYGGCYQSVESWILDGCPEWKVRLLAQMAQALTGVLVVELARRGIHLRRVDRHHWSVTPLSDPRSDMNANGPTHPTPLCALVAAWLEVNK